MGHFSFVCVMLTKVVKEAGFPHTSIWRPGLLGRGDKARGVEKMARFLVTPVRLDHDLFHSYLLTRVLILNIYTIPYSVPYGKAHGGDRFGTFFFLHS